MGQRYLTKVDSLRALAALCVALVHVIGCTILTHTAQSAETLFELPNLREVSIRLVAGAVSGYMAVALFFVISGLVLGLALDRRKGRPLRHYLEFLTGRYFRLYPAHIVAICGAVGLAWLCQHVASPVDLSPYGIVEPPDLADWVNGRIFDPVRPVSFIGNLTLGTWSMNLVAWTLYVEVCVAPLLPLFHRLSRLDRPQVDVAALAALLVIAAAAWDRVGAVQYWFVFYAGMIVQTRGKEWGRFVRERLQAPGLVAAASYLLMVGPGTIAAGRPLTVALAEAAGAFSLVSLIVWCPETMTFGMLDHPALRWAGRLSYSFYLWHFIILRLWVHALYRTLSPAFMTGHDVAICVATAIATVGLALLVARLSYAWVERPGIMLGAALVGRTRSWATSTRIVPESAVEWPNRKLSS